MTISNFKKLARNPLRKKALQIAEAGYEALDIKKAVNAKIKIENSRLIIGDSLKINLANHKKIFLVGFGKGSALACAFLTRILGKKLTSGIVLDKVKLQAKNHKLKVVKGSHPLPSKTNVKATEKITALVKNLKKDDLLLVFICGGGSALLCGSDKELKRSRTVFKKLTDAGADIFELNTVRKHLSEVKGGNLAKLAYPATVVSLIVSDVPGNDMSMVASGPTMHDKTSKKDAEKILKKYSLHYQPMETPKDKKYFKKVKNVLFLSNREPILAMQKKAKELGFNPKIHSLKLKGEAKNSLLPMLKKIKKGQALLAAGETTITLGAAHGKGGRDMESVLGAINYLQKAKYNMQNTILMSFASDARDNTEAAGAMADFSTLKKAEKLGLNPEIHLKSHASFVFFQKTNDLVFARKNSFNVSDLMLILRK